MNLLALIRARKRTATVCSIPSVKAVAKESAYCSMVEAWNPKQAISDKVYGSIVTQDW